MEGLRDLRNFQEDVAILNSLSRNTRRPRVFKQRANPFDSLGESEFRYKYRFSKAAMRQIIDMVRPDLEGDKRGGAIPVDLMVLAAIRCWGRREVQDDSSDLHGFSQPTMSRICKKVAEAFASKSARFISMPQGIQAQEKVVRGFREIRGFPNVIGAIDGTHIGIKKISGPSAQYYINRKGYYSLNIQVVCDSSLRIMDIVAHWRGNTHDSRIFNESRIKQRFESGEFHGRLLGDGGYECREYLFTPVRNPINPKEEAYNRLHISTRNPVERCFGVWKQRFQCLLRGLPYKLSTSKTTIVALAVLHNIAINFKEGDMFGDDIDADDNDQPETSLAEELPIHRVGRDMFIHNFF